MKKTVVVVGALVLLVLTARPPSPNLHQQDFQPLLLRPAFAQTISKPFLPMLVEVLWLRALNAIGLKDSEQKNRALHEYGVVITELDPRFRLAYEFIGLNIPFAVARNTFSGGDLSADMFERGLRAFPTDLKLHLYLGFSLFHHQRKFSQAADVFYRAARLPDALPYMAALATRLKAHNGGAEDALSMTRELLASATDEGIRAELEQRVGEMEVEVVLQRVDRAASAYFAEFGRQPQSLVELVERKFYDGALLDPQGGLISIDPQGRATSTSLKRRMEIFE